MNSNVVPEEPRPEEEEESTHESLPFPVVGVGGSAGGLEAFLDLLGGLPLDPGMAFLFVLHLEPHRKSQLPEILASSTTMTVTEASHGQVIEKNHVYMIPPDMHMAVAGRHIALTPRPATRGVNMPADHLFRSLAVAQKQKAIGVILSGGGTDGSLGFQTIKGEGGITFAQDELSAKQSSMPRAAVVDGNVDFVLPPTEIGRQIGKLGGLVGTQEVETGSATASGAVLGEILRAIRIRTGVDFSHYKRTTIQRRIRRRMALKNICEFDEYAKVLQQDATEVNNLFQDFLIRVTQFFRDPEAFEALKEKVFPHWSRQGRGLAVAHLGRRLRHRRGGLFAGDLPAGISGRRLPPVSHQDPGHRPERGSAGEGPGRHLPGQYRDRRSRGPAAALLREARADTTRSASTCAICACFHGTTSPSTRRFPSSTWSAAATCSSTWTPPCRSVSSDSALRAESARLPVPGLIGERGWLSAICSGWSTPNIGSSSRSRGACQ